MDQWLDGRAIRAPDHPLLGHGVRPMAHGNRHRSGLTGEEQFQVLMAKLHELGLDPAEVIAPHPTE